MPDSKYCYPDSDVLINKLNITNQEELSKAEIKITSIRLQELQQKPIMGKYDFAHLKAIHRYIFQDLYKWAGKERTVEIGKGNLFCTTPCIQSYANSIFEKYYSQCFNSKGNKEDFIRAFSNNYGDLNALHPFREGNGRAQREFARMVCLACGYDFNLSCTTHQEMLSASILSFEKNDSSGFIKIFSKAVVSIAELTEPTHGLAILSSDDLLIGFDGNYDYYDCQEHGGVDIYNKLYEAKIQKMNAEKMISDTQNSILNNNPIISTQNIIASISNRKKSFVRGDEFER